MSTSWFDSHVIVMGMSDEENEQLKDQIRDKFVEDGKTKEASA